MKKYNIFIKMLTYFLFYERSKFLKIQSSDYKEISHIFSYLRYSCHKRIS